MGGRTERPAVRDRNDWIQDVSNERLDRYEAMLQGGGQFMRLSGYYRTASQREHLMDLITDERARRAGL